MEIDLIETDEPQTTLTVVQRAEYALGSVKVRTELAELVQASAAIVEIKNRAGRDECHNAAMKLVRARTTIERLSKDARADAQAFAKAVIAEERSLIGITGDEERRLLGLRDAWDAAEKAARAEAERKERERIQTIQLRVADIRECAILASQCRTAERVQSLIDKMAGQDLQGFDEFTTTAEQARDAALDAMVKIRDTKAAEEQERAAFKAQQEAERALLEALRAEQERAAAERLAEEQRLQAERDELERRRREFQAELDRRAAEARAIETITPATETTEPKHETAPAIDETIAPATITPETTEPAVIEPEIVSVPAEQPTLKLGQICDRLGFTVSAEFLRSLGAEPRAVDKRALLFYESDFPVICRAIVTHIQRLAGA